MNKIQEQYSIYNCIIILTVLFLSLSLYSRLVYLILDIAFLSRTLALSLSFYLSHSLILWAFVVNPLKSSQRFNL